MLLLCCRSAFAAFVIIADILRLRCYCHYADDVYAAAAFAMAREATLRQMLMLPLRRRLSCCRYAMMLHVARAAR